MIALFTGKRNSVLAKAFAVDYM